MEATVIDEALDASSFVPPYNTSLWKLTTVGLHFLNSYILQLELGFLQSRTINKDGASGVRDEPNEKEVKRPN